MRWTRLTESGACLVHGHRGDFRTSGNPQEPRYAALTSVHRHCVEHRTPTNEEAYALGMNTRIVTRILVVLGATSASASTMACGSSDTTTTSNNDAASEVAADSGAVDSGAVDVADTMDATPDTTPDVPCVRRPFLVGAEPRAGSIVMREDWATSLEEVASSALDEVTAAALADAWLEDGRQEHASIAAFSRFAMLAMAVGAPPEIVAGAQRDALDEVRHARGCFAFAARYSSVTRGPGALSLEGALRTLDLASLAALTVHEGCVGETLGVVVATEQHARATDPVVRAFLDRLVRDEQRHAEHAWAFVRWALSTGDDDVRNAVLRAFDEAIAASRALRPADPPRIDRDRWHEHGRLLAAELRMLVEKGLAEVIAPCRAALLDRPDVVRATLAKQIDARA